MGELHPKYLISIEELRNALHYDPLTGKIYEKTSDPDTGAPHLVERFTSFTQGYLYGGFFGFIYKAHTLAWVLYYGKWPDEIIDHKNGDRADNRIRNLRDVSHIENCNNQHPGMYVGADIRAAQKKRREEKTAKRLPVPLNGILKDPVAGVRVGASGVRGVYWNKNSGKWMARIKIDRQWIYLGIFERLDDAAEARRQAEIKYSAPRVDEDILI